MDSNVKIGDKFDPSNKFTGGQTLEPDEALKNKRPKVSTPVFNPNPGESSTQKYLQGPPGPQGATGEKGEKGDKGDRGLVGPKGDKGDVGNQGIKGDKGDRGPAGAKGDRGETGAEGKPGPKGEKGDDGIGLEFIWDGTTLGVRKVGDTEYVYSEPLKGEDGIQGPIGPEGPQGPQGEPGEGTGGGTELTTEQINILNSFSIDANGNLYCNKKLGITRNINVDNVNESLSVNGEISGKDFTSGEALSEQESVLPVVFDVSPENLLVLQNSTGDISSLAAIFSVTQGDVDLTMNYDVEAVNISQGLSIEKVGFEFIVTSMTSVNVGSFDIEIKTTNGVYVDRRRVNVYKFILSEEGSVVENLNANQVDVSEAPVANYSKIALNDSAQDMANKVLGLQEGVYAQVVTTEKVQSVTFTHDIFGNPISIPQGRGIAMLVDIPEFRNELDEIIEGRAHVRINGRDGAGDYVTKNIPTSLMTAAGTYQLTENSQWIIHNLGKVYCFTQYNRDDNPSNYLYNHYTNFLVTNIESIKVYAFKTGDGDYFGAGTRISIYRL